MRIGVSPFRSAAVLVVALAASPVFGQPYAWETYAGSNGGAAFSDGTGTEARFDLPFGIAIDAADNLYVSEHNPGSLRVITPAGVVTTLVKNDQGGSDNGRRGEIRFSLPRHVAFDGNGDLLVTEWGGKDVRRLTPEGLVTLLAGTPSVPGTTDGPLATAQFRAPSGIVRNPSTGDVYVSDFQSHTIRKISVTGQVSTFAGIPDSEGSEDSPGARFRRPNGLAIDGSGNVYVADTGNHKIRRITPGGTVSTFAGSGTPGSGNGTGTAASFFEPVGLAFLGSNLYVADTGNHKIRVISSTAVVSNFAGSGQAGYLDSGISASKFNFPTALAFTSGGTLFVVDHLNHAVRKVTGAGVTTIAGKGIAIGSADGFGVQAQFNDPRGVVADDAGNLYVADSVNRTIRMVEPPGIVPEVSTIAGSAGAFGYDDGTGSAARFHNPRGMSISGGTIYIADRFAHTVRKLVIATKAVTTVAGTGGEQGAVDAAGTAARFRSPSDVAVDASGNLFVADTDNHTIRKIDPSGNVTTFAGLAGNPGTANGNGPIARFQSPQGVAVDGSGNVYVADTNNAVIRKITTSGDVTTFAGAMGAFSHQDGVGTNARFEAVDTLDYGNDGYLYASDSAYRVRRINVITAEVMTIGGTNVSGSYDGTGSLARFGRIGGFAVHDGMIFATDSTAASIRWGRLALNAAASIDSATGAAFVTRQLSTVPNPGSFWQWRLVRRPTGSTAEISVSTIANPTFTPDIPDVYTFRLLTTSGSLRSITEVSLTVPCSAVSVGPVTLPHPVLGSAYSQSISATGGTGSGFTFDVATGALPPGLTLASNGTLSGTPSTNGSYTFALRASDHAACNGLREYTLVVAPIAPPPFVTATGSPSPQVTVDWPAVSGAAGYKVYRRSRFDDWAEIASTESDSYLDTTVTVEQSYVYSVRAFTAAMEETGGSPIDFANTMAADPIGTGGIIYGAHLRKLRTILSQYRQMFSLDSTPTDGTLTGVSIKAVHIEELRDDYNELNSLLGRAPGSFTDAALAGLPVKALHFVELQNLLQ